MAHQFRHLILVVASAAILTVRLGAQAGGTAAKVHFTVFSPEVLTGVSYVARTKPEPKYMPLVFFPSARSPVYECDGVMPLQFVNTATNEVIGSVTVPPGMREPLLVFFPVAPKSGSSVRYHVYVHDDTTMKLEAGGLAVLNFSGLSLTGTIDRKKVELQEGYEGPFSVGTSAKVQLSTVFHGRKLQSYSDSIALGKDGRALLILLPPFRKGSIEVQTRVLLDEVVTDRKDEKPKR